MIMEWISRAAYNQFTWSILQYEVRRECKARGFSEPRRYYHFIQCTNSADQQQNTELTKKKKMVITIKFEKNVLDRARHRS